MTTTVGWILIITSILPVCSVCPAGLYGASCRESNVALNRTTNQSSIYRDGNRNFSSGYAVDGKTGHNLFNTPCTHTAVRSSQPWWTVTLNESYWIYRFTIYNRKGNCDTQICGARLNGFTVSVGTSSGAYITCYHDTTTNVSGPGDVINEHCTSPLKGNTVKISLSSDSPLTLCEVLIYGISGQCPEGWDGPSCKRENVALSRRTSQSSNYKSTLYLSGNAVDGKTGNSLENTPCTHTDVRPNQSWTVTLDKSYWIYRFTIYNRNETCDTSKKCGARLNGFSVSVSNSSGAYITCYQDTTKRATGPGDVINEHCTSPVKGNTVKISLSSNSALTLCEVLIYVCADGWYGEMCDKPCVSTTACLRCDPTGTRCGACVSGKYGPDCGKNCGFCAQGQTFCNTTSGSCPIRPNLPRCMPGYSGEKCDIACVSGKYGPDCGKNCGFCDQGQTFCNTTSGSCPIRPNLPRCMPGYSGEKCDIACVNGKYGPDCGKNCGFCDQGQTFCNTTSGSCPIRPNLPRCMPGYAGEKCDIACVNGKYGPDCGKNCGFCDQGQTFCNTTSGSCPIRPNLPRCMPGYSGEKCDIACQPSKWGADCLSSCGHCYNGPACDKASGECTPSGGNPRCSAGYHGMHCDNECLAGKWGADCATSCGECHNGTACNRTSGECTLSAGNPRCSAGYNGTGCVDECLTGKWGADCVNSCGECHNGTACNRTSGECTLSAGNPRCSAGYRGTLCVDACQAGKWGVDCQFSCGHCYNGSACDKASGECTLSGGNPRCSAGYNGTQCDEACQAGKWGEDCQSSCGHCYNGTACDKVSGECTVSAGNHRCSAGYNGTRCVNPCPAGKWGPDCPSTCGHCYNGPVCDKASGECTVSGVNPRCSAGYNGTHCDNACQAGKWGADCPSSCGHCYNGTACDKASGECTLSGGNPRCSAGYNGTRCADPCTNGTYGPDCKEPCGFCADGRTVCNTTSGYCPDRSNQTRCMPGYFTEKCDQACPAGNWGADCPSICGHCYNGTTCNRTSGECTLSAGNPRCSAGYNGTQCDEACPAGRWGADCLSTCGHCYNGSACDKASGECTLSAGNPRCSAGYNGTQCDEACPAGRWGADCLSSCGHCYNGTVCDKASGECTLSSGNPRCSAGYNGTQCDEACPGGRWGADCRSSCGHCYNRTACDSMSGECTVSGGNPRCSARYRGTHCVDALKSTGEANKIAGGIIGALLLLAAVVVVVVIVYRRRRSSASHDKNVVVSTNRAGRHYDQSADRDTLENRVTGREPEDAPVEMNEVDATLAYENPMTTVVSTDEFWEYYHRKKACDGFSAEYAQFPVGLHAKHDVADLPCNKIKSRYRNLVAYDHSRVVLKPSAKNEQSDYINASYINGYEKPKKFIASQGPIDLIINDFMRMLWEQNVGTVVMVTNLVEDTKKKCHQYWPTEGSTKFGVIEVTLLDEEFYADYNIRILQLSNAMNKPKILKQFHFTAWPDHGAPSDASVLLDFRDKVLEHRPNSPEPIVVHCSAGIGRTGTFIALDYLINQAKEEGVVDVSACVELLRQQRVNMVQTQVQYEFLHEALAEALKLNNNSIPSVNFATVYSDLCSVDSVTGQPKMAAQFKTLEEVTPKLDQSSHKSARLKENLPKNRNNRILAVDQCRPYLSTPVNGCNDYVNAVFLPGYRKKRGFVLTQTPLPTTVVDFWRLVYDHGITTIVMLDHADTTDKNVGIYWTDQKGTFGPFDAEVTDVDQREDFSAWTYQLTFKDEKAHQPIKQFRYKKWQKKASHESIPSFLTLLQSIEAWQREFANAPILVHCRDGASKSGLFCVAWSVLERLKVDQNVNILQTVKHMRNNRPEIITDLHQYRFLHQIVINYLESYQTYANFS